MSETHIGREWASHNIEDRCPCVKAACGLAIMGKTNPECDQHPIERSRTMRQLHGLGECPATPAAAARKVQKAYEDFCIELDTIAAGFELNSKQYSEIVDNECGEQPAYGEWMQETWEAAS